MNNVLARLDDGFDQRRLADAAVTGNQHLETAHALAIVGEGPAAGHLDARHDKLRGAAAIHHGRRNLTARLAACACTRVVSVIVVVVVSGASAMLLMFQLRLLLPRVCLAAISAVAILVVVVLIIFNGNVSASRARRAAEEVLR